MKRHLLAITALAIACMVAAPSADAQGRRGGGGHDRPSTHSTNRPGRSGGSGHNGTNRQSGMRQGGSHGMRESGTPRNEGNRPMFNRPANGDRNNGRGNNRPAFNRPGNNDKPQGNRPGGNFNSGNHNGNHNGNRPDFRPGNNDHNGGHNGNHNGNRPDFRPGNNDHNGGHNGNHNGNRPGFRPGHNDHNGGHHNGGYRPGFRPGNNHHSGYRPGHNRPAYMRPPVRPGRPIMRPWHRPMPPRHWRPTYRGTLFGNILGLTYGIALNAALDNLYYGGYTIDGYMNNEVYLTGVNQFNLYWPDATLFFGPGGGLVRTQFFDPTYGYDTSRYYSTYANLCGLYGMPVQQVTTGSTITATWFGVGGDYISLQYAPMRSGSYNYFTILTIGQ